MLHVCVFADCSNTHHIEHGHAEFIGDETPYGDIAPVFCMEGHEHHGDHYLTCLADGSWSNSSCRLRGSIIVYSAPSCASQPIGLHRKFWPTLSHILSICVISIK